MLDELRDRFCFAFNAFNARNENNNTALCLLGLGLINAYEGDKRAMLLGFKLATDYNVHLKDLTQQLIRQLPFYMYPVAKRLLSNNPFISFTSKQEINTPMLRPK